MSSNPSALSPDFEGSRPIESEVLVLLAAGVAADPISSPDPDFDFSYLSCL